MNKYLTKAGLLILLLLLSGLACAAGEIDFVTGGVTVLNAKGEIRAPARGQRVEPGDTVVTGSDGEVHLVMDDNALIAVRPATRLKIEAYVANGGSQDSVVLNLFRGTFRSITGWIGKNDPAKYTVHTPSATIGIRGTDHEPMVLDEGPDAGTYDKVNSGGTSLTTPFGKIDISPQQAGFVPRGTTAAPKVLPAVPALFKPSANEAAIDKTAAELAKTMNDRLKQKRQDGQRSGAGPAEPLTLAQAPPKLGSAEDARVAQAALDQILRAYELGNVNLVRASLDSSMIGLQNLLDGMVRESNVCKQVRILLLDTQVQAAPDLVAIQSNWQKRCLQLPGLTPQFVSGHTTFLMHRGDGGWILAAVTPGSPLTPLGTNVLATVTVANGATYAAAPLAPAPGTAQPFFITVIDPDRAGAPSITVQITISALRIGQTVTATLLPVTTGSPQFTLPTFNFNEASRAPTCNTPGPRFPSGGPNVLSICPNTTYAVTYIDTTTPTGGAQAVTARGVIP